MNRSSADVFTNNVRVLEDYLVFFVKEVTIMMSVINMSCYLIERKGLVNKQGVLFVSKLDICLKVVLIHRRNLALIVEKRHFIIDVYVLKNLHYPQ